MTKRFKKIYIEITNCCNLDCAFCPKTTRQKAFMSLENFSSIATQVKAFTDYVYLHVMGEPLLHPQLEEILNVCQSLALKVNITTNGTLLDTKTVGNTLSPFDLLLRHSAVRQVNISLHSQESAELEYLQRVIRFCEQSFILDGPYVSLRLWNEEAVQSSKNKLMPKVYLNYEHAFVWPVQNQEEAEGPVKCFALKDHIGILVDGSVIPCCLDSEGHMTLGNMFTESLVDILNKQKTMEATKRIQQQQPIDIWCKRCNFHRRG